MLMLLLKYCNSGTVSCWRKAQVLHSVLHEFSELLPFWPPVEVHSLLVDLLSSFSRVPGGPPAQAPCPLHALPAQQWVVRLVTGCGVPVITTAAELLFGVFGVLPFLHADGDLRLERKRTREMKGFIKWKQVKMFFPISNSAVGHGLWLQWSWVDSALCTLQVFLNWAPFTRLAFNVKSSFITKIHLSSGKAVECYFVPNCTVILRGATLAFWYCPPWI